MAEGEKGQGSGTHKLFVGGVPDGVTEDHFRAYFEGFGEVTDSVLMMDQNTGRCRGFGFVTFVDDLTTETVLGQSHSLDGKQVECKRARPRDQMAAPLPDPAASTRDPLSGPRSTKIFVGGLPSVCNKEMLEEYFSSFGAIKDCIVMVDRDTNKHRGFGFVDFEDPETVDEVIKRFNDHYIENKWIEVKRAVPRGADASAYLALGSRPPRTAMGAGWRDGGGMGGGGLREGMGRRDNVGMAGRFASPITPPKDRDFMPTTNGYNGYSGYGSYDGYGGSYGGGGGYDHRGGGMYGDRGASNGMYHHQQAPEGSGGYYDSRGGYDPYAPDPYASAPPPDPYRYSASYGPSSYGYSMPPPPDQQQQHQHHHRQQQPTTGYGNTPSSQQQQQQQQQAPPAAAAGTQGGGYAASAASGGGAGGYGYQHHQGGQMHQPGAVSAGGGGGGYGSGYGAYRNNYRTSYPPSGGAPYRSAPY
ncbi:unnamed protein product [Vitrella brassicaformis CCMP3155]|uniref:RRM domain-containing protein n=1 Tax=Vitrella brassicaformis (strain CCMP3155) TaxID=1169540 RepID=A0A0G4GWX2_VITBC|nr:unnamed protein product [Vitrella brassicaformis CCMP3155]|eukprot:CEM35350.1 unnamed protein product [Vitrella brassicaformis CCMP3155]